jgi:pimeloyl-ACP methyl ester carboxylesterase
MTDMTQDLVLVPGLVCTAALWAPQIDALQAFARVTVADHSGHDTVSGIAASILAAAPPRFALAGLSLGGYIAFEIMRQAPQRVSRLALLDTSAKPFDTAQTPQRLALIELARVNGLGPVTERLLPMFIHPDRVTDTLLVETVRQMADDTGFDTFVRQQKAIMSRVDSRPTLRSIKVPTLVLTGRQDLLTPVSEHEEIAKGIEGSHLVIVERCGHLSTLERPEAVNEALRVWAKAT